MCFSAEASFAASAGLGVVGVLGLARGPSPAARPLAFLPLLFSAQQFAEGLVWVGVAQADAALVSVFGHVYVFFAFFVWPILVPLASLLVEPSPRRRRIQEWLCAAGVCAAVFISASLVREPLRVGANAGHLTYGVRLPLQLEALAVYFAAVSAPCFSSRFWVRAFGVALVLGLALSRAHFADAYVSLWCFAAALASGAIWFELRAQGKAAFAAGAEPVLIPIP